MDRGTIAKVKRSRVRRESYVVVKGPYPGVADAVEVIRLRNDWKHIPEELMFTNDAFYIRSLEAIE